MEEGWASGTMVGVEEGWEVYAGMGVGEGLGVGSGDSGARGPLRMPPWDCIDEFVSGLKGVGGGERVALPCWAGESLSIVVGI